MDVCTFKSRTKHGKLDFHPGPKYGFEDPDAVPYFVAAGWAEEASGDPDVTITLEELDIDPNTVFADGPNRGKHVQPDKATQPPGEMAIHDGHIPIKAGAE